MKKRFIVLFAVMAMLCCLPLVARAEIVEQGSCGENVTYTLDDQGTLAISGTGEMKGYNLAEGYYSPFYNNSNIKKIIIEDGITNIGACAFTNCSNVTEAPIPDGVTQIGSCAFQGCTSLTTVIIPDSVNTLSLGIFRNCAELREVVIGENVEQIGPWVFDNCESIKKVEFNSKKYSLSSFTSLFPKTVEDVTIGAGTENIPKKFFAGCSNLKTVTLSEGITSIADSVFSGFDELKTVSLPDSLTSIGASAFKNCSSLTDIYISAGITIIDDFVFFGCNSLTNITIPDNTTSIGMGVFAGCSSLASITIPNSLTSIGSSSFKDCDNLKTVLYQGDVKEWRKIDIGSNNTPLTSAKKIYGDMYEIENGYIGCRDGVITSYTGTDTSFVIPDEIAGEKITAIGAFAFEGCNRLTSITIPDSITSVDTSAFEGCSGLKNIYYNGTIEDFENIVGGADNASFINMKIYCTDMMRGECGVAVLYHLDKNGTLTISGTGSIADSAFRNKTDIQNVVIADDITGIGERAFYGCSSMTSVTIGSGVTGIGDAAFEGCTGLKDVNIKDAAKWCTIGFSVVRHEFGVYYYSSNPMYYADNLYVNGEPLTELVIPDGTEEISSMALYNCKSLQSVTIPDSVTSIGNWAFRNCSSLTGVVIPDSVGSIGELAFDGCSAMTSATLGNGVKNIYRSAFNGCSSLTSITITIGNGITSVDSYAFNGCKGLKTLNYNSQKVPDAFNKCKNLERVILGEEVTNIDTDAFSGCASLTYILIPKSVTEIEGGAFKDCSSLTTVYYCGNETEWNEIFIGANNDYLKNANIKYNSADIPDIITPTPPPTPTPYVPLECNVDYEVIDNNITFTVEVKDIVRADELKNVQLYAAEFDENGRFIGLTAGTKSEVQDGKITITAGVPDTEDYKFFLWDGLLAPLMSVLDRDNINK